MTRGWRGAALGGAEPPSEVGWKVELTHQAHTAFHVHRFELHASGSEELPEVILAVE